MGISAQGKRTRCILDNHDHRGVHKKEDVSMRTISKNLTLGD